jgi:hypothetical protein
MVQWFPVQPIMVTYVMHQEVTASILHIERKLIVCNCV